MSGIFITGTDTGVGKTYITLLLAVALRAQGLSVGILKPISCGPKNENDAIYLKKEIKLDDPLDLINPIQLKHSLSPYASAKLENRKLKLDSIFKAYKKLSRKYDLVLVEGVGGALVPITQKYNVCDLISDLDIPAIVVARAGLGTINHTLLTIEALRIRKIDVFGIIMNGFKYKDRAERSNSKIISELSGIPILAEVKWRR